MFEQLKKTHQRFQKFLRELQRADRHRKKRWLIGTTTVSMIIVIISWFFYINATIPSITQPTNNDDAKVEESSFLETFKIGLRQINQTSKEQIEQTKTFLGDQFKRTNEFILEGEQINSTSSEN